MSRSVPGATLKQVMSGWCRHDQNKEAKMSSYHYHPETILLFCCWTCQKIHLYVNKYLGMLSHSQSKTTNITNHPHKYESAWLRFLTKMTSFKVFFHIDLHSAPLLCLYICDCLTQLNPSMSMLLKQLIFRTPLFSHLNPIFECVRLKEQPEDYR